MTGPTRRETLEFLVAAGMGGLVAACKATPPPGNEDPAMSQPAFQVLPLGFQWRTRDPFLFCVHHDDRYPAGNADMGPAASLAGRNLGMDFELRDGWRMYHGEVVPGFPAHPHRGFETVTIVRRGLVDHADSLGAAARYGHGDVQWLTAGRGIQHAEMFPLLNPDRANPVELFQIWLNLPRASKMVDPHFTMQWSRAIPELRFHDPRGKATSVRVIAGTLGERKAAPPPPNSWAAAAGSDVAIWTLKMEPGAAWTLPAAPPGAHRDLYFFSGSSLTIAGRTIPASHQIALEGAGEVPLECGEDGAELLLLQGRPIGEPVVQHGPFVMNSPDEIHQAFRDYQHTRFGGWPWPKSDPVHPRDEPRFARHADGRIDRPT